jgi:hypothetical protein
MVLTMLCGGIVGITLGLTGGFAVSIIEIGLWIGMQTLSGKSLKPTSEKGEPVARVTHFSSAAAPH